MSPYGVALRLLRMSPPPSEAPGADLDVALVRRVRAGDGAAFRQVFERHAPAVGRFLRDLFRDASAADEALQETFVRAHARLAGLRDDARLGAWLLGIARHVYLEARRPRLRWAEAPAGGEDDEAPLEAVLPAPSPEEALLDRELAQHLGQALGALKDERRTALVLRLDHGLPYEEIAQVMGWNLPKVKNEIHRARLQLRAALAPHVGGRR